jgi:hypothetical protein
VLLPGAFVSVSVSAPGSTPLLLAVAIGLEWILRAEPADAPDRLLALLEGVEAAVGTASTAAILRAPGRGVCAEARQS